MKEVKLARNLVNLTGHEFRLYEDSSGEIKKFKPIQRRLWKYLEKDNCEGTYYVINDGETNIEMAKKRFGQNLAVIIGEGIGRGGVPIVSLGDAENDNVTILLRCSNCDNFAYA